MNENVNDRIRSYIEQNKVVLFMKGNKLIPSCGFSKRAIDILKACKIEFFTVNVLEDSEVREGIKKFSDWPTLPQLFVAGEFVGGSDIMLEMFESGDLQKLLEEKI